MVNIINGSTVIVSNWVCRYLQFRGVHRLSITLHRQEAGLPAAWVSLLQLQVTHQRRRLQIDQPALSRTPVNGETERAQRTTLAKGIVLMGPVLFWELTD